MLLDATLDSLLRITCISIYRSLTGAQPARHATLITTLSDTQDQPSPNPILLD